MVTSQSVRGAGITQLVEYQLPKLKVAGSSPVARSISFLPPMRRPRSIATGWIAAVVVASALACAPGRTVDPRSDLDRAVARFIAGDYHGAVDGLKKVTEGSGDDAIRKEAYSYLGRSCMALGDTDGAYLAFTSGMELGDCPPCAEYLELLSQYQAGTPGGLRIMESVTRAQLAGAALRMFGGNGGAPDPAGPTPLAQVEARGWLPRLPDGRDHADDPVTPAALYVFVARVLADSGIEGRTDEVLPGGYRRAAGNDQPVTGREALAALERVREMRETHGR